MDGRSTSHRDGRSHLRRRDVCRPEAQRLKLRVDAALSVMRRPPRHVLEQPNRADATLAAQVEPMMRSAWNADQISRCHLEREHRLAGRMNMKDAPPVDDETYFVLVVPVLAAEL